MIVFADDLTGLAELATQAVVLGLQGIMVMPRGDSLAIESVQGAGPGAIRFINLGCRALPPDAAASRLTRVLDALDHEPGEPIFLKLDSTARGPIARLLAVLHEHRPGEVIPLALINPATGRAIREGRLLIDGIPVDQTEFARDPLHPVTDACLPRWLAGQGISIGLEDHGPGDPPQVVILEGSRDEHLAALARRWGKASVAAGTAAFGLAMLRQWSPPGASVPPVQWSVPPSALVVMGTRSASGRLLAGEVKASGGTLIERGDRVVPERACVLMTPGEDRAPEAVLDELMLEVERAVATHRPDLLVIVGGETAQATLAALGIERARPIAYREGLGWIEAQYRGRTLPIWLMPGAYYRRGLWASLGRA